MREVFVETQHLVTPAHALVFGRQDLRSELAVRGIPFFQPSIPPFPILHPHCFEARPR